jgi:hypothetical protein
LTEIETTDGVTSAEIDLAFIELLPISITDLLAAHTPDFAKVSICVRLSAQTTTLLTTELLAAVATDPAITAPKRKAAVTLSGVRLIFIVKSSLSWLNFSCDFSKVL